MNSPKELFHRNLDMKNWALSIAHDEKFDVWIAMTMGELAGRGMTADQMTGARMALSIFATLPEDTEPEVQFPKPGLRHDIDPELNRKPKPPENISQK